MSADPWGFDRDAWSDAQTARADDFLDREFHNSGEADRFDRATDGQYDDEGYDRAE